MNRLFSHRVTFQVISIVLLILLGNLFMKNLNLNEYVHERVDRDLSRAIEELDKMNEGISSLYMDGDIDREFDLEIQHIINLDRFDREIEKIFNMNVGAFRWYDLYRIEFIINDIKERGYLTKEDEEYLKSTHDYNKRLILAYYEVLKKNNIEPNSFKRDYRKIKKIYIEFIAEANKIAMEDEYKRIREYKVDIDAIENNRKENFENDVSLKEAEELATEVLGKLFDERIILREKKEQSRYAFYNEWEDGKDENLYHISIDKENGCFNMFKRSQLVISPFPEEELNKKAKEFRDVFVQEDYICYERNTKFYEGKLDKIEYKFIKIIEDVYDENNVIEITINPYGYLNNLYISDPLNNRNKEIEKPNLTKEEIISEINKGKIENVILVKNTEEELEYRVFINFNEEIYTYILDANTGERKDYRKGEKMYYQRIDSM